MASNWCARICTEIEDDSQCASVLFLALAVGFRRPTPEYDPSTVHHVPTAHPRMVELVFGRGDHDTIADALFAWTFPKNVPICAELLAPCVENLLRCAHVDGELSPRLKSSIIHAANLIDLVGLVGLRRFVDFLNRLKVGADELGNAGGGWTLLILRVIESEAERGDLPVAYWEALVHLVRRFSGDLRSVLCDVEIINSLVMKGDWEKLECWLGAVCSMRPPQEGAPEVKVVVDATAILLNHLPTARRRLMDWVMDSVEGSFGRVYMAEFQRVCGEALFHS